MDKRFIDEIKITVNGFELYFGIKKSPLKHTYMAEVHYKFIHLGTFFGVDLNSFIGDILERDEFKYLIKRLEKTKIKDLNYDWRHRKISAADRIIQDNKIKITSNELSEQKKDHTLVFLDADSKESVEELTAVYVLNYQEKTRIIKEVITEDGVRYSELKSFNKDNFKNFKEKLILLNNEEKEKAENIIRKLNNKQFLNKIIPFMNKKFVFNKSKEVIVNRKDIFIR